MAYGRPAKVRSHRRGGRRRKKKSRSVTAAIVTVLVVAATVFGYQQLLARTCSGEETVRVLAAPATANHLTSFATEWSRTEPSTEDGTCARVVVQSRDSAQVALDLAGGAEFEEGHPPDVWVPTSTAWARRAAGTEAGAPLIPDVRPSFARSPVVIAMPEPMATQLNQEDSPLRVDTDVRWESLASDFGTDQDWDDFGRDEWGGFRFGIGNPTRDTAGLLALTAAVDAEADGETSDEELEDTYSLSRLIEPDVYHETTEQLLIGLGQVEEEQGSEAVMRHITAFPALEQELLAYNRNNPEIPLTAVYPVDSMIEADHPFLVLNAPWSSDRKQEIAEGFLAHLRSAGPQAALRQAGFRGPNLEAGPDFAENGARPDLTTSQPRAVLSADSVTALIDRWTALTSRLNALLVLDVSVGMLDVSPETGEFLLTEAKAAASELVEEFSDNDQLGFWEFSTALDGDLDYRSLVSIGALDDQLDDGRDRRAHVLDAIETTVAVDGAGLYNTLQAAYDTVLANYDPEAANLVIILTSGQNNTNGLPGLSRDELVDYVRSAVDPEQQIRIAAVTMAPEPDQALDDLADHTGGVAYPAGSDTDLAGTLREVVFGSVS